MLIGCHDGRHIDSNHVVEWNTRTTTDSEESPPVTYHVIEARTVLGDTREVYRVEDEQSCSTYWASLAQEIDADHKHLVSTTKELKRIMACLDSAIRRFVLR